MDWVLCLFVLMFIMVYMCAMHDKGVDKLIERMVEQQERTGG